MLRIFVELTYAAQAVESKANFAQTLPCTLF